MIYAFNNLVILAFDNRTEIYKDGILSKTLEEYKDVVFFNNNIYFVSAHYFDGYDLDLNKILNKYIEYVHLFPISNNRIVINSSYTNRVYDSNFNQISKFEQGGIHTLFEYDDKFYVQYGTNFTILNSNFKFLKRIHYSTSKIDQILLFNDEIIVRNKTALKKLLRSQTTNYYDQVGGLICRVPNKIIINDDRIISFKNKKLLYYDTEYKIVETKEFEKIIIDITKDEYGCVYIMYLDGSYEVVDMGLPPK